MDSDQFYGFHFLLVLHIILVYLILLLWLLIIVGLWEHVLCLCACSVCSCVFHTLLVFHHRYTIHKKLNQNYPSLVWNQPTPRKSHFGSISYGWTFFEPILNHFTSVSVCIFSRIFFSLKIRTETKSYLHVVCVTQPRYVTEQNQIYSREKNNNIRLSFESWNPIFYIDCEVKWIWWDHFCRAHAILYTDEQNYKFKFNLEYKYTSNALQSR